MAALKLVEAPHTRLVDLALDCGFESQEAFTRAFRRTFGITPGELKRRGGADRVCDEESILAARDLRERLTIRPNPARRPAFRVAGLNGRFDRMSSSAIPALWDRLVPRLPLPAQADPMTYGVCYSANWKEGRFNYVAGAAVAPDADLPPEIHLMDIPAQTYLVFDHALDAGAIHQQIVAGIVEILSNRLCAAGATLGAGPDFECYPPGFRPDRPATISYWIPIA
jgi:AraC family transcriptional regulator